jgi:cytoskeletal protein CcmA (bactofilin family)
MWGSKNDIRNESGITLIANNCEIVGDVCFSDQLLVNGIVKGGIYAREESKAALTISENGMVQGEVRVPNIVINGQVIGDVYSDKHVELAANARIHGSVYYKFIEMVKGSRVDGNLVHVPDGAPAEQTDEELIEKEPREEEPKVEPQVAVVGNEQA